MLVCAGNIEQIEGAVPIGVGLVESAINLTKICLQKRPTCITFVGSAGSYGRAPLFGVLRSNHAVNLEHSFLYNESYTPIESAVSNFSVPRRTIINSSNYITCSKAASDLFLEKGVDLENMEFFSVMSVATHFGIEASGIFVVTNYCFENARDEFVKNHKKAIEKLEEFIKNDQ